MSKPERLSHYGVLLIALTAVAVSVWQGRISQRQLEIAMEHNKLTVRPYLEFLKNIDGGAGTLEIELSNQGYGPAVVKRFVIEYDGKEYDAWNPVLEAAGETKLRQIYNYSEGTVIAPGSARVILRIETPNTHKGIKVRVEYESIYQETDVAPLEF